MYETTKDEYGLKAYGLSQSFEKFNMLFGLMLSFIYSLLLNKFPFLFRKKNISIHDALSAIEASKAHFKHLQSENEFDHFYTKVVGFAEKHEIEQQVLSRRRKHPKRYDSAAEPHVFSDAKDYFKQLYYEACNLLSHELESCFQAQYISPVLSMEQLLKAANNENFENEVKRCKSHAFQKTLPFLS